MARLGRGRPNRQPLRQAAPVEPVTGTGALAAEPATLSGAGDVAGPDAALRATAVGNNGQTVASTTVSITIPASAGTSGTDYALVTISADTGTPDGADNGWDQLRSWPQTGQTAFLFGRKIMPGDPGTVATWTWTSSTIAVAHMAVYRNVNSAALRVADEVASNTLSTSVDAPTINLLPTGTLVHLHYALAAGSAPPADVATPSGYSAGSPARAAAGATGKQSVEHAYKVVPAGGTYGGETTTADKSVRSVTFLVALPGSNVVLGAGFLDATPATLSGAGILRATGTGSLTATPATLSGAASLTLTGTGTPAATPATLSGSGTATLTGTGTLTAAPATASGAGTVSLTGTGSLVAAPATLAGTGTLTAPGTGSLAAPPATLSGAGTLALTGTGSLSAEPATLAGSGTVTAPGTVGGTGGLTAPPATLAGTGALQATGSGDLAPQPATLDGTGTLTVAAAGDLNAQAAALAGAALVRLVGTGELAASPATLAATATVTEPGAPRDLTITWGPGRSRTLTAQGRSRQLAATGRSSTLAATGRSRDLAATGHSRTLTAQPSP